METNASAEMDTQAVFVRKQSVLLIVLERGSAKIGNAFVIKDGKVLIVLEKHAEDVVFMEDIVS